jgi:uncharacterized membrane protein
MAFIDVNHSAGSVAAEQARPEVRTITAGDLGDALRKGVADFSAAPTHVLFLGMMYPVLGFVLARAVFQYNVLPLLFPLVAGFAILGPFAAIGLYEISRLREQGRPVNWRNALEVVHAPGFKSILLLGGVLLALFSTWLGAAHLLYAAIFGDEGPKTLAAFAQDIVGTKLGTEGIWWAQCSQPQHLRSALYRSRCCWIATWTWGRLLAHRCGLSPPIHA